MYSNPLYPSELINHMICESITINEMPYPKIISKRFLLINKSMQPISRRRRERAIWNTHLEMEEPLSASFIRRAVNHFKTRRGKLNINLQMNGKWWYEINTCEQQNLQGVLLSLCYVIQNQSEMHVFIFFRGGCKTRFTGGIKEPHQPTPLRGSPTPVCHLSCKTSNEMTGRTHHM